MSKYPIKFPEDLDFWKTNHKCSMCNIIDNLYYEIFNSDKDILSEDNQAKLQYLDKNYLLTGKKSLTYKEEARIKRQAEHNPRFNKIPQDWTYGYAITCWKAQGSEWEKVLVIEENFPFDKEEHKKFLYTAITRASDKVVLIR